MTTMVLVLLSALLIFSPSLAAAQDTTTSDDSLPPETSSTAAPTGLTTTRTVDLTGTLPLPTESASTASFTPTRLSSTSSLPTDPFNLNGPQEADPYATVVSYYNVTAEASPVTVAVSASATGVPLSGPADTDTIPTAPRLPTPSADGTWYAARTVINYTVPASSPMIRYSSNATGEGLDDWQLWYTNSMPPTPPYWQNGSLGIGSPLQNTSTVNASMSFWFVGSAIYIKGTLNGTLSATINNANMGLTVKHEFNGDGTVNGTDMLALVGDSAIPERYNITMTLVNGTFELEQLTVSAPLGGYGSRPTRVTLPMIDGTGGIALDINAIGEWSTVNGLCGYTWNATNHTNAYDCSTDSYPVAFTSSENARLSLKAPANTSLFTIYGTLSYSYGPFQIGTADYDYDDQTQTYTAQSNYTRGNTALYTGALDPRVENAINIDHLGLPSGESSGFDVYQVIFYLAVGGSTDYEYIPGPTYRDELQLGKIIGGAVGGGVGLLLILGGLLWFCLRRRRRRRQKKADALDEKLAGTSGGTRRRAVGQTLAADAESLSMFEVDESEPSSGGIASSITPLPLPTRKSPTTELSTAELLQRKMREAREAHQASLASTQRSGSTLLSPTATTSPFGSDMNDPPTLPPLKLSLMTGDFVSSLGPNSTTTASPSSRLLSNINTNVNNTAITNSPLRTSPLKTSPLAVSVPRMDDLDTFTASPGPSHPTRMPDPAVPVTEEEDAGRLPAETVPPRYNPAWADEYTSTGTVLDSTAGTLLASGPSVLAERQWADHRQWGGNHPPSAEVLQNHSPPVSPTDSVTRSPTDSTRRLVPSTAGSGAATDSAAPSPHSETGPPVQHK